MKTPTLIATLLGAALGVEPLRRDYIRTAEGAGPGRVGQPHNAAKPAKKAKRKAGQKARRKNR